MSRVRTLKRDQVESEVQRHLDLHTDDSVVLVEGEDFLLLKRNHTVPPEEGFQQLCAETEKRFRERRATPEDIDDAIRWARQTPLSSLFGALPATRPFPGKEAVREAVGRKLEGSFE